MPASPSAAVNVVLVNWAALIGVEYLRRAVLRQGLGQRFQAELGVHRVAQPPRQHPPLAQSIIATRYSNPSCTGM